MPLSERLGHIIDTKKIKKTEIARKCEEIGISVSDNYINKILNNSIITPDKEKLEAIATVLGLDKRLLVLENYFDNAPKEIIDIFERLLTISAINSAPVFEDIIKINSLKEAQEIIKKIPLSNFVLEILDKKIEEFIVDKDNITIKNEKDGYSVQLFRTIVIPVLDDSIQQLKKGDKISFKTLKKYKDGDLIVFRLKNFKEKYLIRYLFICNDICYLKSTNPSYPLIKCPKENITILGKVTELITRI